MSKTKSSINSKIFLYPNIFWLEYTQSIIKITNKNFIGFNKSIKMHLSRKKIIHPLIQYSKFKCAFCGRHNNTYFFKLNIIDKNIKIIDIDYKKPIYYCFMLGGVCQGKKLNPNSIEFVAATRKLTYEEARQFIHKRNSTPFYKENHNSIEEYQKYQGTRVFGKSIENIKNILQKQNYSRSLEGYIQRFGEIEGKEKWQNLQKSKGITINNLERKYGNNAKNIVDLWKSKIGPSLINFKNRYGEELGLQKFREFHTKINSSRTNVYGKISIEDGHIFRSNLERKFYLALKENNILPDDVVTDGYYPNSVSRYDFYFPSINLYVEIAGISNDIEYENKLQNKIKKFNPLVLRPKDLQSNTLYDIITKIKNMLLKKNHELYE